MKKILLLKSFNKALALSFIIILSLVLIVPVFSSCSGTATSNTFIELLNLVPADARVSSSDYPSFFTIYDYASVFKDNGVTFSTAEELMEKYVLFKTPLQMVASGSYISGFSNKMDVTTIQLQYMGYNASNVDAELQFGDMRNQVVVLIGRFSPQDTMNALENQSEWPDWAVDTYTTLEYNGVTIHSWGDGTLTHLATRLVPPHIDNLGCAKTIAVTDKYLFSGPSIEVVKYLIDASQNKVQSLADLPEYAAVADGLTSLHTYAAIIADASLTNGCLESLESENLDLTQEERAAIRESMGNGLKKFLTFGSGFSVDEKSIYMSISLYHENSDLALENVSRFKYQLEHMYYIYKNKPWSNIITDSDIKADGNLLSAKLYVDSYSFWAQWVYAQDNLLFHEE